MLENMEKLSNGVESFDKDVAIETMKNAINENNIPPSPIKTSDGGLVVARLNEVKKGPGANRNTLDSEDPVIAFYISDPATQERLEGKNAPEEMHRMAREYMAKIRLFSEVEDTGFSTKMEKAILGLEGFNKRIEFNDIEDVEEKDKKEIERLLGILQHGFVDLKTADVEKVVNEVASFLEEFENKLVRKRLDVKDLEKEAGIDSLRERAGLEAGEDTQDGVDKVSKVLGDFIYEIKDKCGAFLELDKNKIWREIKERMERFLNIENNYEGEEQQMEYIVLANKLIEEYLRIKRLVEEAGKESADSGESSDESVNMFADLQRLAVKKEEKEKEAKEAKAANVHPPKYGKKKKKKKKKKK